MTTINVWEGDGEEPYDPLNIYSNGTTGSLPPFNPALANVAIGYNSLLDNTTGSDHIFFNGLGTGLVSRKKR